VKNEKKAPTDHVAENLLFLPLAAYGGLGLISPSYLKGQDIIFPQLGQSVKPPFCLAVMRVRISISVWHPWLSTLRTMHGYLGEAGSMLLICVPLKAVKTMLAKTTRVPMTTNKLNFSTFIPFAPLWCTLGSVIRYYFVLCELVFDLTKAVRIPKLQKISNIPKKLSLTGFHLI
jgi:hypothetical protein